MPIKKDVTLDDYYAQVTSSPSKDDSKKSPVKIKLKAVVKKATDETLVPVNTPEEHISETPKEKPKARLIEREHASEGLLRSVMSSKVESTDAVSEKKKPAISFGRSAPSFKPLENRPVMALPREERRPPRRDGRPTSSSQSSSSTAPSASPTGEKRIRDDVKPMFQRDIGFHTPNRDGTAKK